MSGRYGWAERMAVGSGKWTTEISRRSLSVEVGVGWIWAVRHSADRSDGDRTTELRGSLTRGRFDRAVNGIDHTSFGHRAVKGQGQAVPLSGRHIAVDEREKLFSTRANIQVSCGRDTCGGRQISAEMIWRWGFDWADYHIERDESRWISGGEVMKCFSKRARAYDRVLWGLGFALGAEVKRSYFVKFRR